MTSVLAAVELVRDRVEQSGIRAAIDPRDLNPPGAWVTIDQIRDVFLSGPPTVDVAVYLIVADQGQRASLANLSSLLDQLLASGAVAVDQPIEPQGVTLPSGGSPLPALKLITTV